MTEHLSPALSRILQNYPAARHDAFNAGHPMRQLFAGLQQWLEACDPVRAHPHLKARTFVGVGTWAKAPWLALLDARAPGNTQRGVFSTLIFRPDMQGVYLALRQGAHGVNSTQERVQGKVALEESADSLRQHLGQKLQTQFTLSGQVELGDDGQKSDPTIIAYCYYAKEALPSDAQFVHDLSLLLGAYTTYIEQANAAPTGRAWMLQCNPKDFAARTALRHLADFSCVVRQHAAEMQPGDTAYLWESGKEGGLLAMGRVLDVPTVRAQEGSAKRFARRAAVKDCCRVMVHVDLHVPQPLGRELLAGHPVLATLSILRAPLASAFPVSREHDAALHKALLDPEAWAKTVKPAQAVATLRQEAALWLACAPQLPPALATRCLVSALTGPYVVLEGPAGSGKTAMVQHLAAGLGARQSHFVAGSPSDLWGAFHEGRWQASSALQFVLRARGDAKPAMLVLDASSQAWSRLAAALECGAPCLPQGQSRFNGAAARRDHVYAASLWPANVLLIGTLHAQRLDAVPAAARGGWLLPARLDSMQLREELPEAVPAPTIPLSAFGAALQDVVDNPRWQLQHRPSWYSPFADHLCEIHRLLALADCAFGRATFNDCKRFAALYAHVCDADMEACLDAVLALRILPRVPRWPWLVANLGHYAFRLSQSPTAFDPLKVAAAGARLPMSFVALQQTSRALAR